MRLGSRNQAQDQRISRRQARRDPPACNLALPWPLIDDGHAEINMDGTTYGALGQPGVGFFMAIIIGALAGWLAEKLTRSDHGPVR